MNCKQFNSIMLKEVLHFLGHFPTKFNEKESWFLNPFSEETKASFKLDERKNKWYLFSEGIGGNNIDFIRKYFNCSISEALEWASNQHFFSFHQQADYQKPNYEINEVSELKNSNLKNYLRSRGLFPKTYAYTREIRFTINNKKLYAIGFENESKGWELRNSFYKGSLLKKDISIISNASQEVYVFEGFIDGLSFIEMQNSFCEDILILNSVALVERAINVLKSYSKINLMLDNDKVGKSTTDTIKKSFPIAKDCSELYKEYKDFNEFFLSKTKRSVTSLS